MNKNEISVLELQRYFNLVSTPNRCGTITTWNGMKQNTEALKVFAFHLTWCGDQTSSCTTGRSKYLSHTCLAIHCNILCNSCHHYSADEDIDSTFPTNVVVSSDGKCLWVPPGLFLSTCKIDITWFPFDDQKCDLKFGSWTYDGSAIDLQLAGEGGDISSFITNGEWELIGERLSFVTSYPSLP